MDKKVIIGLVFFIVIFLGGCSKNSLLKTDEDNADELCYGIVHALDEQDEDTLRKMFSQRALERCDDFSDGFTYATELYAGKFKSMEQVSYSEQTYYDDGKHSRECYATYKITTSEKAYILYLYYFPVDTTINSREGLYRIIFTEDVTGEDYSKYSGIYNPSWNEKSENGKPKDGY